MILKINQEIKGFTVIDDKPKFVLCKETSRNHTRQYIFVRCNSCKKEYYISKLNLVSKRQSFSCFECSMKCIAQIQRGAKHTNWKGYGNISKTHFSQIVKGAKRRNIKFDITIEYMDYLFKLQEGKCAYTGKDLYFNLGKHGPRTNASLDRIDSDEGYIDGNVQWIVKEVNFWKGALNHETFLNMCKEVNVYTERLDKLRNNVSWSSIEIEEEKKDENK